MSVDLGVSTVRHFESEYWDRALAVEDSLRVQGPVHRAEVGGYLPVWVITRYRDARRALADRRLSKDSALLQQVLRGHLRQAGLPEVVDGMFRPHMLFQDDPMHGRLRRLLGAHFTRTRMERLRPRVRQLAEGLVAGLPDDGPFDLVERFSFPLPLAVISEMMDLPAQDSGLLRDWTAELMLADPVRAHPASVALDSYLEDVVRAKRVRPADDLISALVSGSGGERLGDAELLGTLVLLLVAGHETSTHAITKGVRWLMAEPTVWRSLRRNPGRVADAVEETMRLDAPVRMATHRVTTDAVVYAGVEIPPGSVVLVSLMSANRDPDLCDNPAELDIDRADIRRHLSFGHGMHHCIGAPLGRMETEIAIGTLADHMPNARLAIHPDDLRGQRSPIMAGIERLPVLSGRR